MPRIYDSASNPIDFCMRHFPNELLAKQRYGDVRKTGEGPDGRGNCYGYDEDHPPYSDDTYRCHACKRKLTDADN